MATARQDSRPVSAFALAMDLRGFSALGQADHDRVIQHLYLEIASIVKNNHLLDQKSVGDGFMFYFERVDAAVDAALSLRDLFRGEYFWNKHKFSGRISCRIGLHSGQFFWMHDAIEGREALFGRNIITVARLEPIVRENEVWCTNSFKSEAVLIGQADVAFHPLGIVSFAKGWSQDIVFAVTRKDEPAPAEIQLRKEPEIILRPTSNDQFPYSYFALIPLKHKTDGVEHLRQCMQNSFSIEAIYYLFGAYDVLLRFRTPKVQTQVELNSFLSKKKITWSESKIHLTSLNFEEENEKIVLVPKGSRKYMKAFTYVQSNQLHAERVREVIRRARASFGGERAVTTYYRDSDTLVLPIVIECEDYYSLAKGVESIESYVDESRWENVSIITYPVHGMEEKFE